MDATLLSTDIVDWIGWGPDILQLIQIEIQNRKITYPELAEKVHTASGTVASWFSRGSIPADKIFSVVASIGGAKLWAQVESKLPGNAFHTEYLDKTDDSPLAAADDLADAMESARQTITEFKRITRHKKSGFTDEEMTVINRFLDDNADVRLFSQMLQIRVEETFGIYAKEVMDRQAERMAENGYCSGNEKKSSTLARRRLPGTT